MQFSWESFLEFDFRTHTTRAAVENAIRNIKHLDSNTATGKGLTMAVDLFKDIRTGVPRVLVILTDGESNRGEDITTPSTTLKNNGVIVEAVGLGSHYNEDELEIMATASPEQHVFTTAFSDMLKLVADIDKQMCTGKDLWLLH